MIAVGRLFDNCAAVRNQFHLAVVFIARDGGMFMQANVQGVGPAALDGCVLDPGQRTQPLAQRRNIDPCQRGAAIETQDSRQGLARGSVAARDVEMLKTQGEGVAKRHAGAPRTALDQGRSIVDPSGLPQPDRKSEQADQQDDPNDRGGPCAYCAADLAQGALPRPAVSADGRIGRHGGRRICPQRRCKALVGVRLVSRRRRGGPGDDRSGAEARPVFAFARAAAACGEVQASHAACSTIQVSNRSNGQPAWAAISGASDVGVMPGCVFTSRTTMSPGSPFVSS